MCFLPPQSTDLAINIGKLLALGVAPSAIPLAALKELIQRPGVLATPRDLQYWAEIEVLGGRHFAPHWRGSPHRTHRSLTTSRADC